MDVIRFQPGETLTEILDSTATPEQVTPHILISRCFKILSAIYIEIKMTSYLIQWVKSASVSWVTGSRIPAGHAEEGHPRR